MCYGVRYVGMALIVCVDSVSRYGPNNGVVANNLKTKPESNLKWQRVLFKISGSALAGNGQNIDPKVPVLFLVLLNIHWILVVEDI